MNITLALGPSTVFALIVLIAFLIFFFIAWSNIEQGRSLTLRSLRPLNRLRSLLGQSAESGKGLYYSPGSGGLNDQPGAAETLSSLTTLGEVARGAARTGASLEVSANDTLTYLAAGDVAQDAFDAAERPADFNRDNVHFITQQDRLAYIAGVENALDTGANAGVVMLGRFDAEYLLAGETAHRLNIPQIAGSSRVRSPSSDGHQRRVGRNADWGGNLRGPGLSQPETRSACQSARPGRFADAHYRRDYRGGNRRLDRTYNRHW